VALALVFVPRLSGSPSALPRSTSDRPDDRQGAQIHVLYVVPSDGTDRALDTDGTIDASVRNLQGWLRGQTGGRGLRLDTFQSELDVSFHRLTLTDAQIAANGIFVRDALERELKAAGFDAPGKIYAVYYDGSSTAACGGGAWPPALPGNVGALYLRATFGAGFPCYDPAPSRIALQLMDLAILHEVLHTMGFVATCAPHHTRAGHVSDSPNDLMWAGEGSWNPSVLDVGRDDYFAAGGPGCLDLAASTYLEARAGFALTVGLRGAAGTVKSEPSGIDCPPTCSMEFDESSRVTLTATAARGSAFLGWSGSCAGRDACAVTMDGAKSVVATFGASAFKLSVSVRGPGRLTSAPAGISCPRRCSARFRGGLRVTLRPVPGRGARLRAWRGACRGTGRCSVVMTADRSVVVIFR
jgi:hypothetical protein